MMGETVMQYIYAVSVLRKLLITILIPMALCDGCILSH
jgi:hypothetical protein